MSVFAIVPVLLILLNSVYATLPTDQIIVPDLPAGSNTFYIKDEIYTFNMIPLYWVPLQINRHVIYTATSETIAALTQNTLAKKRSSLLHLAPEDYEIVEALLGVVPGNVRVDSRKRVATSGPRRITLSQDAFLLVTEDISLKRDGQQIAIGGTLCFAIPFFTTCDNSADLAQLKATLQASNDELRTELDSYEATNNARDQEMATELNQQKDLVTQLANQAQTALTLVQSLTYMSRTNLVLTQHGDQVIHAQINSLKRMTNSLLRYSNAIGSTDPRAVVAQPAMSKLFTGYILLIAEFTNPPASDPTVRKPILDSRTFNFSEILLPAQAVKNVTTLNLSSTTVVPQKDFTNYHGFTVTTAFGCAPGTVIASTNNCNATINSAGVQTNPSIMSTGWMWGPVHTQHWGLYQAVNSATQAATNTREASIAVQNGSITWNQPANVPLVCVNFLGFTVLTSFTTTPLMINGIPVGTPALPMSSCVNYLLYNVGTVQHYRLFALTEGITVPFYSNCDIDTLTSVAGLNVPAGYLSNYPDVAMPMNSADVMLFDFYAHHYVSPTCYLNMEPEWIAMNYYINSAPTIIPNIPRGYTFNQFTINPQGELASSLEFVYTPRWALVYSVMRISVDHTIPNVTTTTGNRVIVDEIDILDGSTVLFLQTDAGNIIDESDNMFGEGNNGRDCIQVPPTVDVNNAPYPANSYQYDQDLTDCFFQNDMTGNPAGTYLAGLIQTSGISRYNNKFLLTLYNFTYENLPAYTFTLTARLDADFRFYIVTKPQDCAQVISRSVSDTGCTFQFFYQGNETVMLNDTTLTFDIAFLSTISVPSSYWPYSLNAGTRNCMILTCRKTVNSTYVQLDTPAFQVISNADLNMNAAVQSSLDNLMNGQLSMLATMEVQVQAAKDTISGITDLLNTINFNVSELFPYENFTALRAEVDALTNKIGDTYCSGPFQSIQCWATDFGSTLIAVGVVLVVVALVVLFLFKTSAGGKIRAKVCSACSSPDSDSETPSGYPDTTTSYPDPSSKKKPKKLQPPGDFELIASN